MAKKFSERIGVVEPVQNIQTDGMSEDLRNSLWNFIHSQFESSRYDSDHWIRLAKFTAQFFRKFPVDELPFRDFECRKWVKAYFYGLEWYEVYDFIEFLVANTRRIISFPQYNSERLENIYNGIFSSELSGFRFVAGVLAPISNPVESNAISGALETSSDKGLSGARSHIHTALKLLGRKPNPEYRNSVKESISAVESVVKQLSGSHAQGLSGALAELGKTLPIHGAMKQGFIRLYGYTSDSDGIRHAILDDPNVGFDEAKYMLVSCSAFVNYLIAKADAAGLLVRGAE